MQIQAAIVLVIVFFLLLAYGTPVSFSIISAALVTIIMFLSPNFGMFISAQKLVGGIDSFSLLAVPFFILAGLLMSSGGGENHLGSCSQPVLNRNHYRRFLGTKLRPLLYRAAPGHQRHAVKRFQQ